MSFCKSRRNDGDKAPRSPDRVAHFTPSLGWLQAQPESAFDMKTVIAGHGTAEEGVVAESIILNRVIRAVPSAWEYECDQRHAEIILEELDMQGCKPVSTPGVSEATKRPLEDEKAGTVALDPVMSTQY